MLRRSFLALSGSDDFSRVALSRAACEVTGEGKPLGGQTFKHTTELSALFGQPRDLAATVRGQLVTVLLGRGVVGKGEPPGQIRPQPDFINQVLAEGSETWKEQDWEVGGKGTKRCG